MADDNELANLKNAMSPSAIAQLEELDAKVPDGPAREADSGVTSVVFISCDGHNLFANSGSGQAAAFTFKDTTPFARFDLAGKTVFSSLDDKRGRHRFLRGLTSSPFGQIDLADSMSEPEAAWNVSPGPGGDVLTLDGPGPKRILTTAGMQESLPPAGSDIGFRWSIGPTPSPGVPIPPPPPVTPAEPIVAQTFWWGFHFNVPESFMEQFTSTGIAVGDVIEFASTFAGPAGVFVEAFGKFVAAEFELCKDVDQGNGIIVSMSWFAPGIFVPIGR